MQFSKVIVALAAVASVQAANNSSESSSVSTAGAAVNSYGSVISLVSSEGQSFDDELEVTNSTDSENELSEDNIGLEAARRSQAHDSQSGTQNGAPRRSPHGSPHSKSREPSTTSIAHSAAQDSPHLELSHISVHSQSSSEPANSPVARAPSPITGAIPQSTQLSPSTSLRKKLPHLAKPIAVPAQPRYRVGLSKRARVDPLHPYLKQSQPRQPS
ncbi:hypothetical protein KL933_000114 [Ogataea haglerorum]|uniref:Uncharacterized protein n=1 Tax=Ogataea haglerorum TaxID=1937702 RepID=A0AAN6D9A2_9ASCO|nr:hypothetical protein KL933_000114 [Ogataea haglerorum]KAG7735087.1 hypothetical protein KL948_000653 [Ogataea haglerorum]KAG7785875.1 hypothetical protein KL945_003654 [Ogataea haglerorum]KAG7793955.1 hypothetical protein KL910_000650 [Ogataea haglerorum]